MVENAVRDIATLALARGVLLETEIEITARVLADDARLIQVLTNLLSNAIKNSPQESVVVTRVAPVGEGGLVRFSVVDRGPGIAPEKLEAIFARFHQLDSSISGKRQGTGLGLGIARSLVEAHGSTLHVDSEVGRGSNFYFDLPAVSDESG